jgi:tripartite-type tricarboxylate transporter receptor subunit TctC
VWIRVLLSLCLALALSPLHAQSFPDKRITLYVGFGPGGPTDLAFRTLAEAASRVLGQRVIVENKPGVSATLAAQTMARSKPDGYTLAHLSSNLVRMPHMMKLDYDPFTDIIWVIGLADYHSAVVVRNDAPWKTWKEFIAYAKSNPKKVSYATTGVGGIQHATLSEIARREGIDWVMVPYKSSPDASNALLGGEVHASGGSGGWAQFVQDGRMRILVATGDKIPRWPEVPTLMELGYPVSTRAPFGIGVPKGTDPKIVAILHDAFRQALKDPDFLKTLERHEMGTSYLSTADYSKWARERSAIEKINVERLGLKP